MPLDMGQEIEIKLAIEAQRASRVWQALSRFPHEKPSTRRLFCAYYDTPDRLLKRNGVALRLRRDGQRWIQSVKSAGNAAGGLHRRAEHETVVATHLPSFPAMAQAGFGELIADRHTRAALGVIFTTKFSRSSTLLERDGGNIVEVRLDRGIIAAGEWRESICEIELELKAGNAAALFELALEFARQLPVRLENRSKAQRGYELAAGATAAPAKASSPGLTAQMPVEHAFATIAFDCLAHLQANENGLLAGLDPEYLHQARVALRRLRSAVRVFGPIIPQGRMAQNLDELRALARLLGNARNLDVFALETLAQANAADHAGMSALRRRTLAMRRHAARAARAAVASPGYTIMLLQMAQALTAVQALAQTAPPAGAAMTLEEFAARVLSHQHARVKKRGRHFMQLAFPDLHRLRIQVKRLRYASEFFLPLVPDRAANALQSLADLQALLGRLNDDAVAWKLLDTLAAGDAATDYHQAVGYVRGWCARDGQQCLGLLEDAWKKFLRHKPWWKPS
jgi:triphosphatase